MPILSEDVKLLQSERMTDNEDGGGRLTGREIEDGKSNNIFPDISDLDRTYGRVALRKVFAGVHTDDTDTYYGAHLIADQTPTDPQVAVTLFTTPGADAPANLRAAARNRVEQYVVKGSVSRMRLLEDQLPGQRQITVYQGTDAPLPEVGEVLCLTTESGEHSGQEQYVRITDVAAEDRTFEDDRGPFTRTVVTIGIGNPLRYRFYGHAAQRRTDSQPATRVRDTTVADASRYYGTQPLAEAAELGALQVRVGSIYSALVPSAQAETPVVDQRGAADAPLVVPAGDERSEPVDLSASDTIYLPGCITPGTLRLASGHRDDARGNLVSSSNPDTVVGSVDYAGGNFAHSLSGTTTATYAPGAEVEGITHSGSELVTLATQGFNYTQTLRPLPRPGSLLIDFRAQGRWYRLRDDGRGGIVGEQEGAGAGTVDYTTGTVAVTLGALPDVDSAVLYFWSSGTDYEAATGSQGIAYTLRHTLPTPAEPGSVVVTWQDGEETRTAQADAAGGFSGDATGRVVHASGEIALTPHVLPPAGTVFNIAYSEQTAQSVQVSPQGGTLRATLAPPVKPGSVDIALPAAARYENVRNPDGEPASPMNSAAPYNNVLLQIRDDGAGNLVGDCLPGGTIDYATGELVCTPHRSSTVRVRIQ